MWSHTLLFPHQRLFFSVWYNTSLSGKVDELVVLPVIFSNHLICGEISCWKARGFKYCCMINKALVMLTTTLQLSLKCLDNISSFFWLLVDSLAAMKISSSLTASIHLFTCSLSFLGFQLKHNPSKMRGKLPWYWVYDPVLYVPYVLI